MKMRKTRLDFGKKILFYFPRHDLKVCKEITEY